MSTKYSQLQGAVHAYGEAAMENLIRCRALGRAVIAGFADFLECPEQKVVAVPSQGPFNPLQDYKDAAFSFHEKPLILLEPVIFGICVIVDNAEDSGALWLRTAVKVEIAGDRFDVFVAHQPEAHIPLDFEGKLEPIYEALHAELKSTFVQELADFKDKRFEHGIGFIAPSD